MCESSVQIRARMSFADTVAAFLGHGNPHLEDLALESYRDQGRGAVVQDDNPPHSFGISYVTLNELIEERVERARGEPGMEMFTDYTPAIALVESYDPTQEYVYVVTIDERPPIFTTIRF